MLCSSGAPDTVHTGQTVTAGGLESISPSLYMDNHLFAGFIGVLCVGGGGVGGVVVVEGGKEWW